MNIGEVYRKYKDGDHITDEELKYGITSFKVLEDYLWDLGPEFTFPWKEIARLKVEFEGFKRARERK